ncbi:MAG: hypothetical protein ACR2NN_05305 [Bryobacteraceae bacterium]
MRVFRGCGVTLQIGQSFFQPRRAGRPPIPSSDPAPHDLIKQPGLDALDAGQLPA